MRFPRSKYFETPALISGMEKAQRKHDGRFTVAHVSDAMGFSVARQPNHRIAVSNICARLEQLGFLKNTTPDKGSHWVFEVRSPAKLVKAAGVDSDSLGNGNTPRPSRRPAGSNPLQRDIFAGPKPIRERIVQLRTAVGLMTEEIDALEALFS